MLPYCLKCRKNTEKNPRIVKPKNGRIMVSSNCTACGSKKSKYIKEQKASEILSSIGTKIPILSKIFMARNILH